MEFRFTTLGTASARPTSGRFPSAHILRVGGRSFLIDCGEGAQMLLAKNNISFARIDNIFISHLHGDHFLGLFGLLSTMELVGRVTPLHIYSPAGLQEIVETISRQLGKIKYELVFHTISCSEPTIIQSFKNLNIYAFPLNHRIETYGYLFKEKELPRNIIKEKIAEFGLTTEEIVALKRGEDVFRENSVLNSNSQPQILKVEELTYAYKPRSFAYCSDTMPFKRLSQWVEGADLLYHEATYGLDLADMAKKNGHSTASAAAQCAKEAGAGRLILGHYSSRYPNLELLLSEAREIFPQSYLSEEGAVFEIERACKHLRFAHKGK